MKMVIFGGGSSYTPELVDGLIQRYEQFPVRELALLDINEQRLDTLAGLSRRMLARAGLPVAVTTTTERARALDGAAYVNSVIRVGGMEARIRDERVPLRHGVIGQETTGPGGMMKALRTIPVLLSLAHDMERLCPDAWLINYTNPSGIMAEALGKHSHTRFVGLCNGPDGWIAAVLAAMSVEPERAAVDWMGLNHLGYVTRVWVDGKDATAPAIEAVADHWSLAPSLIRTLGVIPCSYLSYYYHQPRLVEEALRPGGRTRGEVVRDMEASLLRQYGDPDLAEKPELLSRRGGGGYSEMAFNVMLALYHNRATRQISQVLNQGAIDDLPPDASVEVPCLVDARGPQPLRLGALPLAIRGLVQAVKAYESLTVQAAVEGSRRLALQALLAHPLVPSWEAAVALLDDLLEANREWIAWG